MVHKSRKTDRGEPPTDRKTKLEIDASAGWREEFRHLHTDPDVRADGGRGYLLPRLGAFVRDREDDDPNKAIVLATHPDTTAREHYVEELDATVAEVNAEYDPLAPVVTVAFAGEFVNKVGLKEIASSAEAIEAAEEAGVATYDFPAPRLEVVDGGGRRV